jgi:hypothetical protein
MQITYNHAARRWEVWSVADDDTTAFIGQAKTYKAARKVARL